MLLPFYDLVQKTGGIIANNCGNITKIIQTLFEIYKKMMGHLPLSHATYIGP